MIHVLAYIFALVALGMFIYTSFTETGTALKDQGIYWFFASFFSALIPHIKQFRYKDLEVTFKEEVKNLEISFAKRIDKLNSDIFLAAEPLRAGEEVMSPERRKRRDEVFQRFATDLQQLPPQERFMKQEQMSRQYLNQLKLDVSQLKDILQKLGFYSGPIDNEFTPQLVDAMTIFQTKNRIKPVDGIFGFLTYQKMAELSGL